MFFYSRGAGAIYVGGVRAPRLRVDGQGGTALVNYLHYLITKCVQFKSHASEDSIGDFEYFDVIGVSVRPFLTMYKLANNSPAVLQTTYSWCTGPNGTSP